MSKIKNIDNWSKFHKFRANINNFPSWPNEIMLKILFGKYSKFKNLKISNSTKVLDIGCGFGNNLIPFLEKKAKCYGTEISREICNLTTKILKKKKFKNLKILKGNNKKLPFKDNFFNLVLSLSVLHYEKNKNDHLLALKEYSRVMSKKSQLLIITTAPNHELTKLNSRNKLNNNDFRKGQAFYFIKNKINLKKNLSIYFKNIEIGRVTETFNNRIYDVYVALCKKK